MAGILRIFPALGRLNFRPIFRPKLLLNGNAVSSFKHVVTAYDDRPVGADRIPRHVKPVQQAILGYALLPFALFPVTLLLIYSSANGIIDFDELSYGLAVLIWLAGQFFGGDFHPLGEQLPRGNPQPKIL
ncbi:MAG: hypothetical protein O3C52_00350 [Proteobacteria bacterium]|nr:hypothetical protein [Pseudomonadota bacterium]MDA0915483.1 hypothetical protein [Pseudomonadota bacterium]MDA1031820.1 hypothetical protein [Pseudomonadota bacterium]